MIRARSCNILVLIFLTGICFSQPGYYPPPSSVNYQQDTLSIFPPDSLPGGSVVLLFYNIYVDDEFYENIEVTDPVMVTKYYLDEEELVPGTRIFCVNAVYNEWISDNTCDTAIVIYGHALPFQEDWSSGTFEALKWNVISDRWAVTQEEGDPVPCATFHGGPGLTDYAFSLESYPVNALGIFEGNIFLDFDLKLNSMQPTGAEMMFVQVWEWTQTTWVNVVYFHNGEGSFDWTSKHIFLNNIASNKLIKIRFLAKGANSGDLDSWLVDNIRIYRVCDDQPDYINIEVSEDVNALSWEGPDWFYGDWIHWDDGVNGGTSIGTNDEVEFEVAARWTPDQLQAYEGTFVSAIHFFPAEPQATYRVRVWAGAGPDTLLRDQLVINPVMNQWNEVYLDELSYIDITKDLWVGYYINTPTGYPAGVDDGPAINGYGNMMYYDSAWQTLLEINPELDYNWNITCYIVAIPYGQNGYYNLYRDVNNQGFQFYKKIFPNYYNDYDVDAENMYCYKVSSLQITNLDTCESELTGPVCSTGVGSVEIPAAERQINMYPNPATSYLNIESPEKINEVRIYNILGECELKSEIGNWEGKVDLSRLQSGIYFVEVVTEKMNLKEKILIFR